MGFLAPWFLAGIAAVGLPIYIHLLRQHKTTPRKFSSLMFFERRTQSSVKHRRLKYLLLFALRTALIVLLVLAFANPYLRRDAPAVASGARFIVIAIDNSFSMQTENRLDRAKQEAAAVLSSMPAGSQGQVLEFGSTVHLLTQATSDVGELRAAVQAVSQSDSRSVYSDLSRSLRSIAQTSKLPVDVHLFSDMQRSSLPPQFADLQLAANTRLMPHALVSSRTPNWTVETVAAPQRIYDPKKARVKATVAGFGTPAARRTVSLLLNGRLIESKPVDVPAEGRAAVEFARIDAPYGWLRGEVRIDSADKLAADDRMFFATERADPQRILFVYDARQPRGLLYFRTALDATPESAFAVEAVTSEQVANISPAKFAAVVISDAGALPSTFEEALKPYVRGGGGVLIAAGPAMAARSRIPVFDETVAEMRYSGREGERFQSAVKMDASHPVLSRVNQFEGVKFYQRVRVDPGKAKVLARLSDDTPLLLEKQVGEGRELLFTSTFDNISNDFPLHASFIPFIEQSAAYLSGQEERPTAYAVDSFLELRKAGDRAAVEVTGPKGERAISLAKATTAKSVQFTQQGFYELRRANGRHELAAVNADRRESDLDVVPAETLALWRNTGEGPAGGAGEERERRWPLGWYVLLALFLVAVVESIFGMRYLSAERERVPGEGEHELVRSSQ